MHTVIALVGVTKKHQKLTPLTQDIALFFIVGPGRWHP